MQTQIKAKTILELIKITESLFREKEISNPRLNAELLIANTLHTERINLYIDFEKPLNETELESFREKVKRRLKNEPLQYILGEAHFFGKVFKVNPSVLIPRPETELLVEKTLELIDEKKLENPKILEIGTGSGCISISIAANSNCNIDALDNSRESIETAKQNARVNGTDDNINFFVCDFLKKDLIFDKYDIIISNPPYIPAEEFKSLEYEIKDFEPETALTDYGDGLEFYRRIFALYNSAVIKPAVLIEIGDGKKEAVEKAVNEFSIQNYTFHKDLLNIYRIISI